MTSLTIHHTSNCHSMNWVNFCTRILWSSSLLCKSTPAHWKQCWKYNLRRREGDLKYRLGDNTLSRWGRYKCLGSAFTVLEKREGRRDDDKCFCNCFWNALFKFQKCIRENGKQTMGTPKDDGKLAIEPPGNKKWVTRRLRLGDMAWFQPNMTISICSGSIPM